MGIRGLYGIVAVVSAHVLVAGAAVPQPAFSFKYGDRAVAGGESVQVDSRLKVTVETKSYPRYDAVEWVLWFENPSAERSDVLSDEYFLRSAYSSSHGVAYWNAIFQDEAKVDWAAAKKCCDEYRRIRRYFPCDFYNHGSAGLDDTVWAIWQYHDSAANEGVVMAFRRTASPSDRVAIQLRGLSPSAVVEVENLDTGEKTSVRGDLEIVLPKRRTSTVLLYRAAMP